MATWAVVGGGVLGSTLALNLAESGHDVSLYEASPNLGGLASAWSIGGIKWDRHYHVTLASDQHTRSLLRRLGLEDDINWVETKTGSWFGGEVYSMSSTWDYVRFPPLNPFDKARLAWTILSGARTDDWRSLEQTSVEAWLRQKSGGKVFEEFWLPLLKAKLGDAYQKTSAAFIWATIQRLYAARSSGMKREMFGYVPGGYARIMEQMAQLLDDTGVTVHLGAPVESISVGPSLVQGGEVRSVDHVVVTAVPPIARRLVEGLSQKELQQLDSIQYQGIVCASVLTRRPLKGYYLTYLHDEAPFTAVVEMSAFVDPSEFGGNTLLYLPKYSSAGDDIFAESDDSIEKRFLGGLRTVFPGFDPADVLAFRISRVRHVFPIAGIGYSRSVPSFDTSISEVHLVSSAQIVNGTLNVNETVELANRATNHLLNAGSKVGS